MATVKSTKKKAAKRPAVKKAVRPAVSPGPGLDAGPSLNPADIDAIAAKVADMLKPAVPASLTEELAADPDITVKTITPRVKPITEATVLETNVLTPEAAALLTPQEVADFNQKEVNKMRARKLAQQKNRKDLEKMGTLARSKELQKRDPNVIRMAIDPNYDGDDYVRVECLRRIGLDVGITSDLNEMVDVPREAAKRLQQSGAVRVAI